MPNIGRFAIKYFRMKKYYLFIVLLCFLSFNVQKSFSQTPQTDPVSLTLDNDDHNQGTSGMPKTPITPPEVSIYGHTLYFSGTHAEFVLTLTDEEDNVVFTTIVYDTDTQVVLPSSLSGVFKLRLYTGIYCFVGEITL